MPHHTAFHHDPPRWLQLALLGLAFAVCAVNSTRTDAAEEGATPMTLPDVHGNPIRPLAAADHKAAVLIFTTVDCPIANTYAPEMRRLYADYHERGVKFTLVHVDPDLSDEDASAHARDYRLEEFALVVDRKHVLVVAGSATITPEAVVFSADGKLRYRGRIDNLYAGFGDRRNHATETDLRNALDAVLAGKPVPATRTEAIGCSIPELE